MIHIKFIKKNNLLESFKVTGHAEAVKNGKVIYDDVVCGVVSALTVATINGITDICKMPSKFHAKDGDIFLDISKSINSNEIDDFTKKKSQVLMETLLLSFKNLEITQNEYIKLKVEEV